MSSEPELEPFDFGDGSTTAGEQARLAAAATKQRQPPRPIAAHRLPDVFVRPDAGDRPALAALRSWIVERITGEGTAADRAVVYADLWIEYAEAQDSIDRRGMICLHPRTSVIIENPYVARRDKTHQALAQIRDVSAPWLWQPENMARVTPWLDVAVAQRDDALARAALAEQQTAKAGRPPR